MTRKNDQEELCDIKCQLKNLMRTLRRSVESTQKKDIANLKLYKMAKT